MDHTGAEFIRPASWRRPSAARPHLSTRLSRMDIELNGQQVPIALKDKKIVDGRQRERACIELGITPRYEELPDDIDPARFLMAMHRKYRDLSKNDLALARFEAVRMVQAGGRQEERRLPTPPRPFRTCA